MVKIKCRLLGDVWTPGSPLGLTMSSRSESGNVIFSWGQRDDWETCPTVYTENKRHFDGWRDTFPLVRLQGTFPFTSPFQDLTFPRLVRHVNVNLVVSRCYFSRFIPTGPDVSSLLHGPLPTVTWVPLRTSLLYSSGQIKVKNPNQINPYRGEGGEPTSYLLSFSRRRVTQSSFELRSWNFRYSCNSLMRTQTSFTPPLLSRLRG